MSENNNISITRSIIIIPLLLVFAFTLIGFGMIDIYFKGLAEKRYETDLMILARTGANMLELSDKQSESVDFDNFADSFAQSGSFRITIINETGEVLGDSRLSKASLTKIENYSDRPEIIEAGESGTGRSTRYSNTLQIDLLYIAVRFSTNNNKGYFRVALPLTNFQQDLIRQRLVFATFALIALVAFSILSLLASRYLLSLVKKSEEILEGRVQKRTSQIETLQNIGTQMTVCNSIKEGLEVIQQGAAILLPRFIGALALFNSSKDKLELVANWNGDWPGEKHYPPEECWAMRTGQQYYGNPGTEKIPCDHYSGTQDQMLCLPIIAQGDTYGIMHFFSNQNLEWTFEEIQLAASIAEHASLTFANLKLKESLKIQAIRDPLTGLFNRRYLIETLDSEISRANRKKTELTVIMADLDHFKQFNDEYGHDVGDFILSEFGQLIKTVIREEDTPCRYGGEEFTILLPETDRVGASLVTEKIRNIIRNHDFVLNNQRLRQITLSMGVAIFPDNADSAASLLKKADEALYTAKSNGRDCVVIVD